MKTFRLILSIVGIRIKAKSVNIKMSDFENAVRLISEKYGKKYYSVSYECSVHSNGLLKNVKLTGYIDGDTHRSGNTIQEVCDSLIEGLDENINKKSSVITEIQMDI